MRKLKKILILIAVVSIICLISVGLYFLFKKLNITSVSTLRSFVTKFGAWSWVVFILLQVCLSVPIFVIPLEDELWVTLSILLFGTIKGFIISVIGMLLTSSCLYLIGNKLGIKIVEKIMGKKAVEEMQTKYAIKNKLSLPFLYLIPFIPHDSLCVLSGINKLNFLYFVLITLPLRSIEIVAICFLGGDFIIWSELRIFDWLVLINLVIIDIFLLKKLQNHMEKKFNKKTLSTSQINEKQNDKTKESNLENVENNNLKIDTNINSANKKNNKLKNNKK